MMYFEKMRNSLSEDDDEYYRRRLERRTEKCRVRTCVFGFTDIVYTGLGLIFCLTILAFHIRQDQRKTSEISGRLNAANNINNGSTNEGIIGSNDFMDNYSMKSSPLPDNEVLFGVNFGSPFVFYGIQLVCLVIKLIGAILLFIGNQKRKRPRSNEESFEEVQFNPTNNDEFVDDKNKQQQPSTSTNLWGYNNSPQNNNYNNAEEDDIVNAGNRKTRFGRCSCKTWIILNIIVLPFLVFKIVQYILRSTQPFYNQLLLIETIVELVYRIFGLVFILDYLQFIRNRVSNRYFVSSVSYNDIPPSYISCIFCKSWCILFNECC